MFFCTSPLEDTSILFRAKYLGIKKKHFTTSRIIIEHIFNWTFPNILKCWTNGILNFTYERLSYEKFFVISIMTGRSLMGCHIRDYGKLCILANFIMRDIYYVCIARSTWVGLVQTELSFMYTRVELKLDWLDCGKGCCRHSQ